MIRAGQEKTIQPLCQTREDLVLALDQGGQSSRAVVYDCGGRKWLSAQVPVTTRMIDEYRVEQDAEEILGSMLNCIQQIAQMLGPDVNRLKVAGLATQRASMLCWDRISGKVLSPVLSWQDRRNAQWLAEQALPADRIAQLTGLVLSPHYGASKLRWCLDHLEQVEQARQQQRLCCGPVASYLLYGLLQEKPFVVDPSNASRTQLWSPASSNWCPELLGLFDIPGSILPHPVPTRFKFGTLAVGPHKVPLTVCTGDQAAVPFAQGALDHQGVYINFGTGAFMLAPLKHDIPYAAPLLRSVLYADGQESCFALEGTVNGAAAALNWLVEHTGIASYELARALTSEVMDEPTIPVFINGVGGVGSPYWFSSLESRFIESSGSESSDRDKVAAVLESMVFLLFENLQLMRRHHPSILRLRLGGGLSRVDYLCQCLANLIGMPVQRMSDHELTAQGTAYLAAGKPLAWDSGAEEQGIAPFIMPRKCPPLAQRWQKWRSEMVRCAPY